MQQNNSKWKAAQNTLQLLSDNDNDNDDDEDKDDSVGNGNGNANDAGDADDQRSISSESSGDCDVVGITSDLPHPNDGLPQVVIGEAGDVGDGVGVGRDFEQFVRDVSDASFGDVGGGVGVAKEFEQFVKDMPDAEIVLDAIGAGDLTCEFWVRN